MISSDFREEARRKLDGKWGKAVIIVLAFLLIAFAINFVGSKIPDSTLWLWSILEFLIEIPLGYGLSFTLLNLYKTDDASTINPFDFFTLGFSNFGKSFGIFFSTLLKMLIPVILMIIALVLIGIGTSLSIASILVTEVSGTGGFLLILGIILGIVSGIWGFTKSYYYILAQYFAMENPDLSASEAVQKCEQLMFGKRSKLFILQLTFIGWAILAIFTFGIGYLWLIPYIQFATIAFYMYISGQDKKEEPVQEENLTE